MLSTFTSPLLKIVDNYELTGLLQFSHLFSIFALFLLFTLLIFFFASFSSFFMPTFFSFILFLLPSRLKPTFFPPTFHVVFCFSFLFFLLFPYLLPPFFLRFLFILYSSVADPVGSRIPIFPSRIPNLE
jgi:hypothetical protein